MTSIFVFTAGNADAQKNLRVSIERPIPAEKVLPHFPEEERETIRGFAQDGGFYAWGAIPGSHNIQRWKVMAKGDWVLCTFANRYKFVAQVLGKFQNREVAESIWGTLDGQTWELMYFLTKPQPIDVPVSELSSYLHKSYQGSARISDSNVLKIEQQFGSIEAFVNSRLVNPEARYFIVRSNETSNWADEVGKKYRYGETVPNYTKLIGGARVVVDRKTSDGVQVLGYGELGPAAEAPRSGEEGRVFESPFVSWKPFDPPQAMPEAILRRVTSSPGYNVQHAMRPITRDIYDDLCSLQGRTDCWIFQANPALFDVRGAIRKLKHLRWLAKQHASELKAGNTVYLWESGKAGGIIAEARILEPTSDMEDDRASDEFRGAGDKFEGVQPRVVLEILRSIDPPLGRDAISANAALKNLSILRAPQGTNFPVTEDEARALKEMLTREPPMDFAALLRWTLLDETFLRELVDAVAGQSKQIILAGPPGTSKTRVALALSEHLTNSNADRIRFVQFHPSYSYESFIEGLRPVAKEGGGISFEREDGVVLELVKTMTKRGHVGPDAPLYVIVIDEMNRANLPRVLGELMFLMEYRAQSIRLQYSTTFSLPENLRFIGTMNTADRSIRSIDIALRRRFDVFELWPSTDILERYYEGEDLQVSNLGLGLRMLNDALEEHLDKHHKIGHAYLMQPSLDRRSLRKIWDRKLYPLIEEYFFDQESFAKEFSLEKFWPLPMP